MQNIVITGVSSGIGESTARYLKEKGYNVIGGSRKKPNINIEWFPLDLTSEKSVYNFFKLVVDKYKTIDVLINNAGIGFISPIEDVSPQELNYIFNVNLFGHINLTNLFVKNALLPNSKIINISSIGGVIPLIYRGIYSATKSALISLSLAMHVELKRRNIEVICILPGDVITNIHLNRLEPQKINLKHYPDYQIIKNRIDEDEMKGIPALKVAKKILKIINRKKNPPVIVVAKPTQKIFYYLWHILPNSLALYFLKKYYGFKDAYC